MKKLLAIVLSLVLALSLLSLPVLAEDAETSATKTQDEAPADAPAADEGASDGASAGEGDSEGSSGGAADDADAVTSASVNDFYGAFGLSGDELMESINSYNGFFAVASVNPDGTPNIGFYIFSCVKYEDKYYLQLGLSPNQTTENIENGSALMAMYAQAPTDSPYATAGARMILEKVEDAELIDALKAVAPQGTEMFYEIVKVRPLG